MKPWLGLMPGRRATLIGVVIVAAAAVTTLALESGGESATASGPTSGIATAAVVRTTLASRQQASGTLERAGSYRSSPTSPQEL